MNLLEKLSAVRLTLQRKGLGKTGKNTYSNYDYYELADFMPAVNEIMAEQKLIGMFNMDSETATLCIVNAEKPEEQQVFTLPVREAVLKGAHPIQNLGAMVTYMRRYLWMAAMELVESDALDAGKAEQKPTTPDKNENDPQVYCQKFDVALEYLKKQGKYDADAVKELFTKELGFENYQRMEEDQIPAAKRVLKVLRGMAKATA